MSVNREMEPDKDLVTEYTSLYHAGRELTQLRTRRDNTGRQLAIARKQFEAVKTRWESEEAEVLEAERHVLRLKHTISCEETRVREEAERHTWELQLRFCDSFHPENGRIPPEILMLILRHTLLPWPRYDPSVIGGPRSPWMDALRARISACMVCKSWLGTAREALYQDVVIRRIGQVSTLARTLRSPVLGAGAGGVGSLVKSLRVDACLVPNPLHEAANRDLAAIFLYCTGAQLISFHPADTAWQEVKDGEENDPYDPAWYVGLSLCEDALDPRIAGGLRELDLFSWSFDVEGMRTLHRSLSAASALITLRLGYLTESVEETWLDDLPVISLPALEELDICMHPRTRESAPAVAIARRWVMPRLLQLTVIDSDVFPRALVQTCGASLTFVQVISLRSLTYTTEHAGSFYGDTLQQLPQLCPRLQHLVLSYRAQDHPASLNLTLKSSTLRYLDFWGDQPPSGSDREAHPITGIVPESIFVYYPPDTPSLERVRFLGYGGWPGWGLYRSPPSGRKIARWPRTCHPSIPSASGEDILVWQFGDMRVVQTPWALLSDAPVSKYVAFGYDPDVDDGEESESERSSAVGPAVQDEWDVPSTSAVHFDVFTCDNPFSDSEGDSDYLPSSSESDEDSWTSDAEDLEG